MSANVDAEGAVLHRAFRDVVLGEKTFRIKELVRCDSRKIRHLYIELEADGQRAQATNDSTQAEDVTERLLSLIYEASTEIAAAREYIESNATDRQILVALAALRELVADPFVSATASMAPTPNRATRRGEKNRTAK